MPAESPHPTLQEYASILWLRKWSIAVVTALVLAIALFYSYQRTPIYQSAAQVLVKPVDLRPTQSSFAGSFNMETEKQLATSTEVADLADVTLRAQKTAAAAVSVSSPANTEVLTFRTSSSSRVAAQRTAQAFAEGYLQFRRQQALDDLDTASQPLSARITELDGQIQTAQTQLAATKDPSAVAVLQTRLDSLVTERASVQEQKNQLILPGNLQVGRVIQPAGLPTSPSSPNHQKAGGFALFAGLALGIGLAFVRDAFDHRIRSSGDLELQAGVPVLAAVPADSGPNAADETFSLPLSGHAAYKLLDTIILAVSARERTHDLMVASCDGDGGKTATIVHLGIGLARSGKHVVLVAADFSSGRLAAYFRPTRQTGLSDLLAGDPTAAADALDDTGVERLRILHRGRLDGVAEGLLGQDAMGKVLAQLEGTADFVLIDVAPILTSSDAIALAQLTDGVLLVAEAGRTTRHAVREAMRRLDQARAVVIGAVLTNNDARRARTFSDRTVTQRAGRTSPTWPPPSAEPGASPPRAASSGAAGDDW